MLNLGAKRRWHRDHTFAAPGLSDTICHLDEIDSEHVSAILANGRQATFGDGNVWAEVPRQLYRAFGRQHNTHTITRRWHDAHHWLVRVARLRDRESNGSHSGCSSPISTHHRQDHLVNIAT
jgi:hypothetical protein